MGRNRHGLLSKIEIVRPTFSAVTAVSPPAAFAIPRALPQMQKGTRQMTGSFLHSRYASWSYSASCSSAGFSAFFSRFLAGFSSTWTDSSTSIS